MSTAPVRPVTDGARPDSPPVVVPAPPVLPEPDGEQSGLTNLLPMTGAFSSVALVVGAGPGGSGLRGVLMAASVLLSSLLMVVAQVARQRLRRRREVERARASHLHQVRKVSDDLRRDQESRRAAAVDAWPALQDVSSSTLSGGVVRIGTGTLLSAVTTSSAEPPPGTPDPVCVDALARFADAHALLPEMPVTIDLTAIDAVVVRGPVDRTTGVLRALVLQASRRRPDELAVAILCSPDELPRWDWAKWLPHTAADRWGSQGPLRLADHRLERLLALIPRRAHTLVVMAPGRTDDLEALRRHPWRGRFTLVVADSDDDARHVEGALLLDVTDPTRVRAAGAAAVSLALRSDVVLDTCSATEAAALARRRCLAAPPDAGPHRAGHDLTTLLSPAGGPTRHRPETLLRVPVGTSPDGDLVHLDLKEAALGGHGPHGLLVGATGSGKSEMLRTLVVALVGSHLPDDLALVLVDFKGGATFADVEHLPHVAACVTNLADDTTLVERMQDALGGELERRQELLHTHGHANIHEYRAARERDASLPPLPHLFVCVDEFSELLTARPDFVELFTAVGRLGRSLGIHLLLASQRLDEGRLTALEAHLSYRIALRTFSSAESRAAIGTPDAHTLPKRPGAGLLRTGAEEPVRFDALHVGADAGAPTVAAAPRTVPFTVMTSRRSATGDVSSTRAGDVPSVADVVLDRTEAATRASRTHRIWLPPLPDVAPLSALVGRLASDDLLGLHSPTLRSSGLGALPLGLIDRPRLQRREVLSLDLTGARGHVAVVGAPRTGRSTAVATLVNSIVLAMSPSEAHLHVVDLGGGALADLAELPHTVSYSTRHQPELVARVVEEVRSLVAEREKERAVPAPEVFLVVDGWGTLRQDFEEAEATLVALAPRALAVGVHLVATAVRWAEIRPALLDVLASRVELRLGDPFDSTVDRRAAASVPYDRPGRGVGTGGAAIQVALPGLTPDTGLGEVARHLSAHWRGQRPTRVRELPSRVHAHELPAAPAGEVPVGIDEAGRTLAIDAGRHFVVTGPEASGRTTALRHHVSAWSQVEPRGQFLLLDPRGSLAGLVGDAHLLGHAATATQASELLRAVCEHLTGRLDSPAPAAVPVSIVIDDLDLLRSTGVDLSALTPLLPRAESIGLRVVIGCRGGDRFRGQDRLGELLTEVGASVLTLTGSPTGRGSLRRRGTGAAAAVQCPAPSEDA